MTLGRPGSRVARAMTVPLLFVTLATSCSGVDTDAADETLPAVELVTLRNAAPHSLAEPTEAPRVINLWATWCAPCRAELPEFDEVAEQAGSRIAMLGVNVGESRDRAVGLIDELDIGFPQSVNPSGDITEALGVVGLPATLFVDAEGRIVELHNGALDADHLRDRIDEVLGVTVGA